MKRICLGAFAGCLILLPTAADAGGDDFTYNDPGVLTPGSGSGATDATVYAPGMRYPMEEGPSYPNSQVWGHGGGSGPGGGQCDEANYSYPWWDNYCETRSWDMPLCPSGVGHQGQDIRPGTCDDGMHWNVASEAGMITNIGGFSVYVTDANGTRFDYLHGTGNIISSGQSMAKGERINRVSNEFNGTPTTIHLHFNIKQDVAGLGFIFVSPYMSLVESYQELLGITTSGGIQGSVNDANCTAITGWAQDGDNPETSIPVQLFFDGMPGEPDATAVEVTADVDRPDLCEELGSCAHGFEVELPRSLQDDANHDVFVFGVSGESSLEIESSPGSFQCPPPAVPSGVRRMIEGPDVVAAWGLSPFWDAASLDVATIDAIAEGEDFPLEPVLVRSDSGDDTVYLMDPGYKRPVPNAAIAETWGLDFNNVAEWPAHVLDDVAEGTPLRDDVFMVQSPGGVLWVIDDEQCALDDPDCEPGDGNDSDSGSGGDSDSDGEAGTASSDGNGNSGGGTNGDDDDDSSEIGGTDGDTDSIPGGDGDDSGCGCSSAPGDAPVWLLGLFGVVAIGRRRGN